MRREGVKGEVLAGGGKYILQRVDQATLLEHILGDCLYTLSCDEVPI